MTAPAAERGREHPTGGTGPGVPFDARLFGTVFPDRLRAACPRAGADVPVVLLDLADGRTLDLCHVDLLGPTWMGVSAFRGKESCGEMDTVFVPYERIALVTITRRDSSGRNLGFQADRVPEWQGSWGASPSPKEGDPCTRLAQT
jgi:hypothetical protein